ncbi:UNVERIFIED_CONTAM: hypothetical protein PYX00_005400 [Menopon gallinae]|uniref:Uncharacterized protein n=1 Tax=Menopon gallinae TaxID=328185 RepID=A0AAW2HS70_9NEOP
MHSNRLRSVRLSQSVYGRVSEVNAARTPKFNRSLSTVKRTVAEDVELASDQHLLRRVFSDRTNKDSLMFAQLADRFGYTGKSFGDHLECWFVYVGPP